MADEKDVSQTPVPPPPLQAPDQQISVLGLVGSNRGKPGKIPVESYAELAKQGKVDLLLPTQSPEGQAGYTPLSKWKEMQGKKYTIRHDDPDQIPVAYQLTKELETRSDKDALTRFLSPFWGAIVGSLPEAVKAPLQKGEAPTIGQMAKGLIQGASGYHLFVQPSIDFIKNFYGLPIEGTPKSAGGFPLPHLGTWGDKNAGWIHIPKAWVEAAKMPTQGEGTAAAVSALPVPLAPNIAQITQKATTGDAAGAAGESLLLAGFLAAPKILEGAHKALRSSGLDEKIPAALTKTREAYNLGIQREVMNELGKISVPGEVAANLRKLAGAQVEAANLAEFDRIEKIKQEGRIEEYEAARNSLVRQMDEQYDQLTAEQARRVQSLGDLEHLAQQIAGPRGVGPLDAAGNAIEVLNGVKGSVDSIETAAYEPAFQRAEQAGVQTNLGPVGTAIMDATKSMIPAQEKLGISSVDARDLQGAQKMGAHALGLNEAMRALELGDMGALTATQQDAVRSLMGQMTAQGGVQIPFKTAVEAERGLSSMVRRMQQQHNPELAPRIRLLRIIRNSLREQNDAALSDHPEVQELYDQAKRVTVEQNTVIGDRYIRKFFGDPRYRDAAETLIGKILTPRRAKMAQLLMQGMRVGPQAETALSFIDPAEADRISTRIAQVAGQSAEAAQGLRRAVVDEMLKVGTKPSTTPGVDADQVDYNRMESWLRDRPAAKILLGDGYQAVLDGVQDGARQQLAAEDPIFERTMQRLAAKKEALDRQGARANVARRKLEDVGTKVKPPEGAEAALKPMTESQFTDKVLTDPQFRSFVKKNSSPAEQQTVLRNVAQKVVNDSMFRGAPGDPDAIMDMEAFGKGMAKAADAMGELGDPKSTYILRGLGRAAERAGSKLGLLAKIYFWYPGPFKGALAEPRVTGRINYGPLAVNAQEILRENQNRLDSPGQQRWAPRPFAKDIVYASQDPALASMMRSAMETDPWKPGAGVKALQYLVAFGSAGRPVDKPKVMDDKTAQEFIRQFNGDVQLAADHAMSQGYTR